jgi:hypothetical protein
VLLGGCVATSPNALPKYEPPPTDAPAAIIDAGIHSRAWSIDGAETPSFATTLRIGAGEHRVGINCLTFDFEFLGVAPVGATPTIPLFDPHAELRFMLVTGSFKEKGHYYVRCAAIDGHPRAWLADTPDGTTLPDGFTAICTRGCAN